MKNLLFSALTSLSVTGALACTPGAGNGPSGDPNCMGAILNHDPYYNGSQQNTSRPPKKIIRHITVDVPSKYGAIAHNPKTGIAGGSIDMPSLQEAKKEAIKRCENGGQNAPCKVVAWVRNGCLATAKGLLGKNGKLFKAVAKQPGQVEQLVLNQCISSGASGCKIYAPEGCSIPEGMNN